MLSAKAQRFVRLAEIGARNFSEGILTPTIAERPDRPRENLKTTSCGTHRFKGQLRDRGGTGQLESSPARLN